MFTTTTTTTTAMQQNLTCKCLKINKKYVNKINFLPRSVTFSDNWQKLKFGGSFCGPFCCHGNGYGVTASLKVLPGKRGVKIFIVCRHEQKYFVVILPCFKRIITVKNPFNWYKNKVTKQYTRVN